MTRTIKVSIDFFKILIILIDEKKIKIINIISDKTKKELTKN